MTARHQVARLLPLVLLVVLVIAGLRGAVPAAGWTGPLARDYVPVGIALEVILITLLAVVRVREHRARALADARPAEDTGVEPGTALRYALTFLLGISVLTVAGALFADLNLHFTNHPKPIKPPSALHKGKPTSAPTHALVPNSHLNVPFAAIGYALLVVVILAAIAVSIWYATRSRAAAPAPVFVEDTTEEELREAVAEGQAALAELEDDRAAIIAAYAAMERRLAERGTARGAADTPDELLARAVASGTVRGAAAGRLTSLFYEARFSTHPLASGQREAAGAAFDELAAELGAKPA